MTTLLSVAVLGLLATLLYRLARLARAAEAADWGHPVLNRLDGLNRLLCRRYHRLPEVWLPIPPEGPALVASNHVSGLDPLLLIAASRRPLRFIIAREQYDRPGLAWLFRAVGCIPVDRSTRPELALRAALRALRSGEVVALFPHGRIHLDRDPPRPLKPGVAWLARQAGCPVIPARIHGVRAEGHIILAPFARSRAGIQTFAPLACASLPAETCLARLADAIEGRLAPAAAAEPG